MGAVPPRRALIDELISDEQPLAQVNDALGRLRLGTVARTVLRR